MALLFIIFRCEAGKTLLDINYRSSRCPAAKITWNPATMLPPKTFGPRDYERKEKYAQEVVGNLAGKKINFHQIMMAGQWCKLCWAHSEGNCAAFFWREIAAACFTAQTKRIQLRYFTLHQVSVVRNKPLYSNHVWRIRNPCKAHMGSCGEREARQRNGKQTKLTFKLFGK